VRRFLTVFPLVVAAVVVGSLAVPMGEFVELGTVDADGNGYRSEVWMVEVDGVPYLRSGWPDSHWLDRLRATPRVEIERDGHTRLYRAVVVDDATVRDAVNRAMAAKYGVADWLIRRAVDMEASVPVRLEPVEGLGGPREH